MQRESAKAKNLLWKMDEEWIYLRNWLCRFCFLAILFAGCNRSARPNAAVQSRRPFEGLAVQVACPGEPCATVLKRYGQIWEARTGGHIVVKDYDPAGAREQIPAADLWILGASALPSFAVDQELQTVPSALTDAANPYNWNGLLPLYRSKLLVWDQTPYALPFLDQPWLCFFRTDLLSDPNHQAEYKKNTGRTLAPPATWEDLTAIATHFNDKPRPGLPGRWPSLSPLPAAAMDLDYEFYLLAAPYARHGIREDDRSPAADSEIFSFHYDLETMQPRINGPGFVRALAAQRDLLKLRPAGTSAEPPASFERGEAIICLAPPSWIARFDKSRLVAGKFGVGPAPGAAGYTDRRSGQTINVPGGNTVPYQGALTYVAAVPRVSTQPEAAWELAAFLSDPHTSRDTVIEPSWGGGAYRNEHLENRAGWQSFGLSPEWTGVLVQSIRQVEAYSSIKNPLMRLRIPQEASHRQALDTELEAVLLHGKEPEQALNDAASRWRQLDVKVDPRQLLRDYRLSLGLSTGE